MKTVLITLVTFFAAQALASFQAGYIDMQRAIQSTKAGKSARTTLEQEFNRKKDELKKKEESLKKEAEAFEKKRMVLSEKKRAEQQEALQKKMMAFQQELQQSQANIQKKEQELTQPILEKLQSVVDTVAKRKKYHMVFEKGSQSVMWAQSDLDITDEVIKEFEKQQK